MGTTAVLRHSAPAAANSRREVPWKDAHRRIDQSPCAVCVWCPNLLGEPAKWMCCRATTTRHSGIRSLKHHLQPKLEALHEASK